jgi:hypothetical protein
MESPDTHKVFCFTFGSLSLWLSPVAMVWTGRILSWALLAWAWRRLSFAVVPRAWWSVLTGALFACLMERCQMAGEWVIGGVEAKTFAYVFVLLGIESLVRDRWNRGLALFGAAAAFHALVGGWAAVAAGIAWFLSTIGTAMQHPFSGRRHVGPIASLAAVPAAAKHAALFFVRLLWPGILGGLLLSLPGLIPSLMLDWGVDRATAREAHSIYVFERLPHHLTLSGIQFDFIGRMALLWMFWLLLGQWDQRVRLPDDQRRTLYRLRAFVGGAIAITLVGVAVNALVFFDPALAADLLRYYWFRLTDVALPLGVALEVVALIVAKLPELGGKQSGRGLIARGGLALAILVAAIHVGYHASERLYPDAPRSHRIADFDDWHAACEWVVDSGKIPAKARFLVPRDAQTFQWYTGRNVVVDWKDVPQDAKTLLEWHRRIRDIYATGLPNGPQWYEPLAKVGAARLKQLGAKYDADYVITERTDPLLKLPLVYQNETYVIYRLK